MEYILQGALIPEKDIPLVREAQAKSFGTDAYDERITFFTGKVLIESCRKIIEKANKKKIVQSEK